MLDEDRKPTQALLKAGKRYKKLTERLEMDEDNIIITLSDRDRDIFLEALETPPEPNEKLREAAKRHKEMIIENE